MYILLVNFKKALGSIHKASFVNILRKIKILKKLINLVEVRINGTKIKVKLI